MCIIVTLFYKAKKKSSQLILKLIKHEQVSYYEQHNKHLRENEIKRRIIMRKKAKKK